MTAEREGIPFWLFGRIKEDRMTNAKEIKFTMDKTKHIALVAHDGKKKRDGGVV